MNYVLAVSLIFCLFIAALKYKNYLSSKFICLCLCTFIFSIFYADYKAPITDALEQKAPANLEVTGIISSVPKQNLKNKTKFEFDVNKIITKKNTIPTNSKTLVSIFDYARGFDNLQVGDKLKLKARIKQPYQATNPGQFDYKKYLKTKNIHTLSYVKHDSYELIEKPKDGYWYWIQQTDNLRRKIINAHSQNLKSPNLEILGGVVFGNDAINPPQKVKDDFINSGLFHLLAASGMNVGLIFGIWYFLCSSIKIPYKLRIISGGIIVILYALMTGLPPSVVRATGMLEFILLGKLLDRDADNITLLGLVCALILINNPMMLNDIGFQLSFLVTLGLLLCTTAIIEKIKNIPQWLSGWLVVPFIAQVWAAPIQMFYFNTFALYSVVANMLVIPFIGIITFCGFIGSILSLIPQIGTPLCFISDKIADPFISLLLFVSELASNMPHSLLDMGKPLIIQLVLFYLLIIIITFAIKKDFDNKALNITSIVLAAILTFIPLSSTFSKNLSFVFFDVGEGDGILIRTPDQKTIIVDTGTYERYGFNPAKTSIIPYLKDIGVKKLDAIILTHPDSDHIGGAINILDNFETKVLYTNGDKSRTKTYKKLIKQVKSKEINIQTIKNNQKLQIDKNIEVIAFKPTNSDKETFNDTSIILYIKYKDFSALLAGDSESNAFKLYKNVENELDLLKVGHHGSYDSVSNNMLKSLNPEISVISVGRKNNYGHPHIQTIKLLKNSNTKIMRTDIDNAIKVSTNGENTSLMTFDSNIKRWKNISSMKNN